MFNKSMSIFSNTNILQNEGDILLPCGFTVRASYEGLKKAWKAYKIAKNEDDIESMIFYSTIIRRLQGELGLQRTVFECLTRHIRL